ncbi:MAG TPA: NAD-dependent epimerase/dehydratase family protein [Anaeromyxobacteraceae bacterium]|nr:NAD-dependent epimerase/dehydratase family protein [Anaeromyxobacteraceae bacterium]
MLILGGTGFLGPAIVEVARARGHVLTLFNRGKTHPGLFPDLEQLHGDRDGKLDALRGRSWDAAIDTSGYVPRIVKMSADLLAPAVARYLFVSTISVYEEDVPAGSDETAKLQALPEPGSEDVPKHYGALKVLCERAVEQALPGRAAVVRPGLIVGPGDPTDRFTYWPVRLDRGGEVLAPGEGGDPVQVIDVRDLAAFLVSLTERADTGTYNAVGPARATTVREMLEACRTGTGSTARLTWVPWKFLDGEKVAPWSDMPAVVPAAESGLAQVSIARALAKGLSFRTVADTARDTLAWWKGQPEERRAKLRAGLSPQREAEVLARWHGSGAEAAAGKR